MYTECSFLKVPIHYHLSSSFPHSSNSSLSSRPFALPCLWGGRGRDPLHLTGVTSMIIGRVYLLEGQNCTSGHDWLPLAKSGSHTHLLIPRWRWRAQSCAGGRHCLVSTGTAACHRTTVISTQPWAVHSLPLFSKHRHEDSEQFTNLFKVTWLTNHTAETQNQFDFQAHSIVNISPIPTGHVLSPYHNSGDEVVNENPHSTFRRAYHSVQKTH